MLRIFFVAALLVVGVLGTISLGGCALEQLPQSTTMANGEPCHNIGSWLSGPVMVSPNGRTWCGAR